MLADDQTSVLVDHRIGGMSAVGQKPTWQLFGVMSALPLEPDAAQCIDAGQPYPVFSVQRGVQRFHENGSSLPKQPPAFTGISPFLQ